MPAEFTNFISAFWMIFSFSFLVALTGAMAPGPLLTYTIIKSIKSEKYGYLTGLWIIVGHAALEMAIIIFLLFGFSFVLENIFAVRTIGILGGVILIYFGVSIFRDVYKGRISISFLESADTIDKCAPEKTDKGLHNPIVGGILVSMSNPYWWIWWATIGFALMVQFKISFKEWPGLLAFFLGHEAGDLLWYLGISCLTFFGLRYLNRKVYYGILICCAAFMMFFGLYLGGSLFFKKSF